MTGKQIAKCPAHATFDEAEVGAVSIIAPLSNSEHSAAAHFEAAGRETQCACGNSFSALEANMRIGGHLSVLKEILPRGSFGREVKARLGFDRQWSSRLMQLPEAWSDVLSAIEWGKSENRVKRSELGVDSALALVAEWKRANEDIAEAASKIFDEDGFVSNDKVKKQDFIYYLKLFAFVLLWELERKRKLIVLLESELRNNADAPCPDQLMLPLPEHMQ